MPPMPKRVSSSRRAFTLVELLVVMSIMLILATIAVLFVPRALEQEKATTGARQLVGWLQMAKTQALRDQAARGVRLLPYTDSSGTLNGTQVRQLQFIQQPGDYVVQPAVALNAPVPIRRIQIVPTPFSNTSNIVRLEPATIPPSPPPGFSGGFAAPTDYPVQPGDYLEISGGGLLYQIIAPITNDFLTLRVNLPPMSLTPDYRIIRAPRVSGEDPLQLPLDVGIDITPKGTQYDLPAPLTGSPPLGVFDVLFAPSGAVVGQGAAYDKIIFWVRDMTQLDPTANEPQLVCIYTRSGAIAVHPVDVSGSNYYTFTADGRSSGE